MNPARAAVASLGLPVLCRMGWFTFARSAPRLALVSWFRALPLT